MMFKLYQSTTLIYGKKFYEISKNTKECIVNFTIENLVKAPVSMYIHLTGMYLNHRDLIKSKSFDQLRALEFVNINDTCKGARTMEEMMDFDQSRYINLRNETINATSFARPCGLHAKSIFNDTINLQFNERNIKISTDDLANKFDRKSLFKSYSNSTITDWTNTTDERFIVWMQMESWSNFKKLWGRINEDLIPGNYTLKIINSKIFVYTRL